jgi:SPOR domain
MRVRFLAVSEEIAKDLSSLTRHIGEEPTGERAWQLAAAKEIAAAEERLRTEVSRLAGPLLQRVAIMKSVLVAQQGLQLQLIGIAKGRTPSARLQATVNEQLANIDQQLTAGVAASPLAVANPTKDLASGPRERRHTRHVGSTVDRHPANDGKITKTLPGRVPLAAIVLLLVALSAGLVLFYADLQGAHPEGTGASQQLVTAVGVENAPPLAEASPTANAPAPQLAPPPSATGITVGVGSNMRAPALHREGAPPYSPANSGIRTDGMQPGVPAPLAPSPVTTAPGDGAERFVPVVFTHKEKATALLAFAELQRRYSKTLTHRQSELQMVDTSKNGIWYRVVVLPAGSRQEASDTCGRLEAAGHDRCWVKPY